LVVLWVISFSFMEVYKASKISSLLIVFWYNYHSSTKAYATISSCLMKSKMKMSMFIDHIDASYRYIYYNLSYIEREIFCLEYFFWSVYLDYFFYWSTTITIFWIFHHGRVERIYTLQLEFKSNPSNLINDFIKKTNKTKLKN